MKEDIKYLTCIWYLEISNDGHHRDTKTMATDVKIILINNFIVRYVRKVDDCTVTIPINRVLKIETIRC